MAFTANELPKPGVLDSYINEIKNHELLTREQEKISDRWTHRLSPAPEKI